MSSVAGSFNSFERELRKQKRKIMLSKVRARNRPHNQKFFILNGRISASALVDVVSKYMPVKWEWSFFVTGSPPLLVGWKRQRKLSPAERRAKSVDRERLAYWRRRLNNGNGCSKWQISRLKKW